MTEPRGIRNHNPGNIRHSKDQWEGMASTQSDSSFVQFVSPEYGIRAMVKVLLSYRRRGIDTLGDIIRTWAPPNENNTKAYIDRVARDTGLTPKSKIGDRQLPDLITAIIAHENGKQPYSANVIEQGIALALG